MPIVGPAFGKLDFKQYFFALGQIPAGTPQTPDAVRQAGKQAEALQAAPQPNPEIALLREIRDALKTGGIIKNAAALKLRQKIGTIGPPEARYAFIFSIP